MENNTYSFVCEFHVCIQLYTREQQVTSFAKSVLKGIVMFSEVLPELCQTFSVRSYSTYFGSCCEPATVALIGVKRMKLNMITKFGFQVS